MDLQKDEECHLFRCRSCSSSSSTILLHIWCCYKTYTIKGLLLCPWCVVTVVANLHQTETGHHATNHFFLSWETTKQRGKNLDKLRFYWANMRKKNRLAILHESNQSLDAMLFTQRLTYMLTHSVLLLCWAMFPITFGDLIYKHAKVNRTFCAYQNHNQ